MDEALEELLIRPQGLLNLTRQSGFVGQRTICRYKALLWAKPLAAAVRIRNLPYRQFVSTRG